MYELGALRAAVERRRGSRSDPVSEDDIVRAIKKLKVRWKVDSCADNAPDVSLSCGSQGVACCSSVVPPEQRPCVCLRACVLMGEDSHFPLRSSPRTRAEVHAVPLHRTQSGASRVL
jgi:hypothetical protein